MKIKRKKITVDVLPLGGGLGDVRLLSVDFVKHTLVANHRGPLRRLVNNLDPRQHVVLVNRLEQELATYKKNNPSATHW